MNISGKTIVAVFAHPDDEAFGPSGTLHKLAQKNDLYLICVTNGDAGENNLSRPSKRTIGEIRRSELRKSAQIIGIKKVYFLDYVDGTLSNSLYHEIAEKIEKILNRLKAEILITFESGGISGHIDHIAVSMITTYVFKRLPFVQKILYSGMLRERAETRDNYFIYVPPGYKRSEFDLIVDVSDVWDTKLEAMRQHKSQAKDMANILEAAKNFPKEEYFLVKEKGAI